MPDSLSNSGFHDFVYGFHKGLTNHEIILSYEGDISHQIMKAFTELVGESMEKLRESEALQIKVYHVMVECLQNINKHAVHPVNEIEREFNSGVFLISRNNDYYCITTGNFIKKERITHLTQLLVQINSLSGKQINELYKKQLKEGHLSEKGGAGLGLIDIRRKTGNDLEFGFQPVSETHSFFVITSKVPRTI